ncbi:hypothetical protein IMZ48_17190 [Candidatus Bathyarchaeota archaeon]|nr:hypothetical protein [Candidatus Bathyarchaeota archaeon]
MHFPSLGGQGRADMVGVDPTSGHGHLWFNSCPRGGDDGKLVDPGWEALVPEPIEPPKIEDHWFCSVEDSSWDAALWKEHGMGDWLNQRSVKTGLLFL